MTGSAPRRDLRWWGWGNPAAVEELSPRQLELLQETTGGLTPASRPESIAEVEVPAAASLPRAVVDAVGEERIFTGAEDRVRHGTGRGYVDLVGLRAGRLESTPDAVALPEDAAAVERLLGACVAEGVAVVPFGGGTSVVGGVAPLRGRHERLLSLDLSRLQGVAVDRNSLTARLGAGLRGPEAEAALAHHGLTLGHFPQSFEYATIGGFAATRSAGQASSGYGRFDDLVTSIRLLGPAGCLETVATPHTAAGPSLRELVVGSEGTLGVIPDVSVRVRPVPEEHRYEAWMAEGFGAGAEIVRNLAQGPGLPDVIRVSDEEETRMSLALSGPDGAAGALFDRYLRARRRSGGCLVIAGFEGTGEGVKRRRAQAARELRRGGAVYLGQGAGRSWEKGRFHGPYLRDALMDAGAIVETLETAHTWSGLDRLYRSVGTAIRGALEARGTPGIVLCHISHAYTDGASLYFTFVARGQAGAELEQWRAVKAAACEAIVDAGGTITHHHAIGRDHAPYMKNEVGEVGLEALRAVKERLDPTGIMNPEKLLPS